MPVTSLENQIRGLKIWGLPKVVNDIDIFIKNNKSTTIATDELGNDYLKLSISTNGKNTAFNVQSNLYSVLHGEIKQSKTCFKGDFNVTKNLGQLFGKENKGNNTDIALTLGSGEHADVLRSLKINPVPFQTRYCKSMDACFDLPNSKFSLS